MIKRLQQIAQHILETDPRATAMQEWQRDHPEKYVRARLYYRFLFAIAEQFQPKIMVELGTDHGFGAWHLAAGFPGGTVIAVDRENDRIEIFPDNVTYVIADTIEALPKVGEAAVFTPINVILFDSTHSSEHAMAEFEAYDPCCCPGAIQMFDDITESRDMRLFWKSLPGPKIMLPELHPKWGYLTPGFGVRVKP